MWRYFSRKLLIYMLTFIVAVTVDWCIPRFMPGNPVDLLIARAGLKGSAVNLMYTFYMQAFGLNVPLWQQYINFWIAVFHGDLGTSIYLFPTPVVKVIMSGDNQTLLFISFHPLKQESIYSCFSFFILKYNISY